MSENQSIRHWFALYTKPRHEIKTCEHLKHLQVDNYLPLVTSRRKWADRIKTISEPLIKGYVFIFASEKERLQALKINSVVHTVCFNGKPAIIPGWQIDSLKKMIGSSEEVLISEKIPAGTLVKVLTLPLNDVIGVVEENSNNEKYISIAIEILNRTVSVKLAADAVVKIIEN